MDFPATRWTLIAHLDDPVRGGAALDHLCGTYWGPIYAFLLRSGRGHTEAEDLTQEFLGMVVRQRLLERSEPGAGKLRSWLLAALRHFLANARRHESRQKRGGEASILSLQHREVLSEIEGITSERLSPDEVFDRAWVAVLLRRVLENLTQQYHQAGKAEDLHALLPWLLHDGRTGSQAGAAADAGMTIASFRVQLHRLRGRYRESLRREITATLEHDEDYQEELEYLFRIAGRQT